MKAKFLVFSLLTLVSLTHCVQNSSDFYNAGMSKFEQGDHSGGLAPYKSDNFILNFKSTHNSL
jgi:hypothetical protein